MHKGWGTRAQSHLAIDGDDEFILHRKFKFV